MGPAPAPLCAPPAIHSLGLFPPEPRRAGRAALSSHTSGPEPWTAGPPGLPLPIIALLGLDAALRPAARPARHAEHRPAERRPGGRAGFCILRLPALCRSPSRSRATRCPALQPPSRSAARSRGRPRPPPYRSLRTSALSSLSSWVAVPPAIRSRALTRPGATHDPRHPPRWAGVRLARVPHGLLLPPGSPRACCRNPNRSALSNASEGRPQPSCWPQSHGNSRLLASAIPS